jgi:Mg/Co/Ni transporter MgtE
MAESMELAKEFIHRRPDYAAKTLEDQPSETVAELLVDLPTALAGKLLGHLMPVDAGRFLDQMSVENAATLVGAVEPSLATALLRHTRADHRAQVTAKMPAKAARACRSLLRYPENTVGTLMDTGVFVLPDDITVESCIRRMRRSPERTSGQIFVLDRHDRLRGVLQVWDIVRAKRDARILTLIEPQRETLPARTPFESIANHPAWKHTNEMPVVETGGTFVGILRHISLRKALGSGADEVGTSDAAEVMMGLSVEAWQTTSQLLEAVVAVATAPSPKRQGT